MFIKHVGAGIGQALNQCQPVVVLSPTPTQIGLLHVNKVTNYIHSFNQKKIYKTTHNTLILFKN